MHILFFFSCGHRIFYDCENVCVERVGNDDTSLLYVLTKKESSLIALILMSRANLEDSVSSQSAKYGMDFLRGAVQQSMDQDGNCQG